MKIFLIAVATAFAIACVDIPQTMAAPTQGAGLDDKATEASPIDQARLFCADRFSGRFLHWGLCYSSAPRVYCRNRFTGQFLHWGFC